uniref:Photosystem II CP43 chlorophyll apoprotein n=1 Tax=Gongylonema pulchrum TaxID=637853 RepID=A0A183DIZ1_9BILA
LVTLHAGYGAFLLVYQEPVSKLGLLLGTDAANDG